MLFSLLRCRARFLLTVKKTRSQVSYNARTRHNSLAFDGRLSALPNLVSLHTALVCIVCIDVLVRFTYYIWCGLAFSSLRNLRFEGGDVLGIRLERRQGISIMPERRLRWAIPPRYRIPTIFRSYLGYGCKLRKCQRLNSFPSNLQFYSFHSVVCENVDRISFLYWFRCSCRWQRLLVLRHIRLMRVL